jgi:hypothetical protein
MPRTRTIIPHCGIDSPIIDAFHCSRCQWLYRVPKPEPFLIAWEDAENACIQFDAHCCEDFSLRATHEAAHEKLHLSVAL